MERPDELNQPEDVEQLKAEISETQAELQQTVAEIQERLSPATLKHQAADTVREAASNVRDNVRDATIGRVEHMMRGQNPIPYALIGIGAAWLLASNRSSGRRWNGGGYNEYDASWSTSTSHLSSEDEFASPYAGQFGTMRGARGGGAEWSEEARQRAGEVGQKASEMTQEARDRARMVASRARSRWDSMLHENPMALGIAALAAGALVGAVLPTTDVENEYLGETRDTLVDSAREMAHDGVESAKSLASETIGKVAGSDDKGARP